MSSCLLFWVFDKSRSFVDKCLLYLRGRCLPFVFVTYSPVLCSEVGVTESELRSFGWCWRFPNVKMIRVVYCTDIRTSYFDLDVHFHRVSHVWIRCCAYCS